MKRPDNLNSVILSVVLATMFPVATALAQTQPTTTTTNRDTSAATRAPAVQHTIRGKIFLPSGGVPDQRMRVVLELTTGGVAQETFSDSIGNFEFRMMPSNSYRVVVPSDHQNFEAAAETVDVFGNFSRTFTVQIYLRNKGEDLIKTKDRILTVAELQEVPKPAKKFYEQGLKRAKENKPADAIKQFEEALKIFPDYLLALNKMGEQYLTLEQPAKAEEIFESTVKVNGKYPLARINLGMLYFKTKRYDPAIEQLEEAIHSDDSYPMAHLYLGLTMMEKQPPEVDRAEKELTKAVELGGKEFSYVRLHIYNLNLRRQSLDKAAVQLEAYLKESPNAPNAPQVRDTLDKIRKQLPPPQNGAKKP
jgi:tetratricopeptide (TPR) repeat protein